LLTILRGTNYPDITGVIMVYGEEQGIIHHQLLRSAADIGGFDEKGLDGLLTPSNWQSVNSVSLRPNWYGNCPY
jgi:hypothetical protein